MSIPAKAARSGLATTTTQIRTASRFPSPRSFTIANTASNAIRPTNFYKTFGRPISKVFLLAIFTYQVIYYFWVRLEQDEMKREMNATISELEARISELEAASTNTQEPASAPQKKGWW